MSINARLAPGKNAILSVGKNAILVRGYHALVDMAREVIRAKNAIVDSRKDHYTLGLDEIYALNLDTGVEINLGDGVAVAIPDGNYRMDVRTSADLWKQARNNSSYQLVISGGEITLATSLPTIVSLSVIRTSTTKISIEISGYEADSRIGLWFSPITPVVTTGPADVEIEALENIYLYEYDYSQSSAEYVAVACLTDTEQGISSELYLPMIPSGVSSPDDQFAQP